MIETPLSLARKAGEHLSARGFENGRLEAELLLASVLCVKRLDLYLQHDRPIDAQEVAEYRERVRRRLRHEPLQYITGEAAFRRLTLRADPRALIPRPETEVLVGEVMAWGRAAGRTLAAVDIGTGTGAIALSLALEGAFAPMVATDISAAALSLAAENVTATGATGKVELRHGDLFGALDPRERFDVVVSNPPYVAERDRASLPVEVAVHEPASALFAGPDGLAVIDALVSGAPAFLRPGGLLALELAPDQADVVAARIVASGDYREPRVVADLAGRPRVVLAVTTDD